MLFAISGAVQFDLVREVAQGGMGTVYEALEHGVQGFSKRVAIKMLLPEYSGNAKFVQLFISEAKLVADLVHENIVQIYQLGYARDEGYYIVMEYVHGLSLGHFIDFHAMSGTRIPTALAVFIVSRIARGLAYAHSRRSSEGEPMHIVHRDICPSNILVTTEGLPKVTDFGIAKAANQVTPFWGGKVAYMSPEQARRESVDFRSDLYSLGLVLFELLSLSQARLCWRENLLEAAREGRVDIDSLPDGLDGELLHILHHMLAADLRERYDDTSRVARDLEYHIYQKGYGPTVVTLEDYLQQHFPYLSRVGGAVARREASALEQTVALNDYRARSTAVSSERGPDDDGGTECTFVNGDD